MAVESFPELLQKLREVHEHDLEGWQEKVLELTNKKNIDTKRMEELYNRNQQLREQQRMLTENIKQLENRLRAGLCDRCTVTQDVAKKRQQEYENSQLQSLQHISLLVTEMSALKKENDRLREELKSLRERTNRQNGHSEDSITPEVNLSLETAVAAVTLMTSGLKSSQPPPGDATVPAATGKSETENSPNDSLEKASEHKRIQGWGRAISFESNKSTLSISSPRRWGTEHGPERRAASVDSLEQGRSPLSSLPSPFNLLKSNPIFSSIISEECSNRQQIHTPVPFRPLPMKNGHLPWPLSESTDWVTVSVPSSGIRSGMVVHPSQTQIPSSNILRFPKLVSQINGLQSHTHGPSPISLRAWSEHPPRRSREKILADVEDITNPHQWRSSATQLERIFGENLREDEEEVPLDLSESGCSKSKEKEKTQSQSDASSSSSLSAPFSSLSQCTSNPQSDLQTGDNNTQEDEAQQKFEEQEEVKEDETSPALEMPVNSENMQIPSLTISLQPVVVMETLKPGGQTVKVTDPGTRSVEPEQKENNNHETSRKRAGQDTDSLSQRSLKEKKIRSSR
ncbi:uncharacterized protein LOC127628473 [Xyrauchen texanus]|uniref:uncharacterized protein LOC127628473 n=1 Tax=Xyrauchen texanus TaxID=154827 RepID=UPI002241BBBB|nr:uncharacterized protein LOC127628473 [Xyrauchen texanus]